MHPRFLAIASFFLVFVGCNRRTPVSPVVPADVQSHIAEYCGQYFPKRGESYLVKGTGDSTYPIVILEFRGLSNAPSIQMQPGTEAETLNGLSKRYVASWGLPTVYRMAAPDNENAQLQWSSWQDLASASFREYQASPALVVDRNKGTAP